LPDQIRAHFATCCDNDAGGFVTENERAVDDERPDAAVPEIVHVGAAHANAADRNQHLVIPRCDYSPILERNLAYTDENGGTHPIVMGSYGIGLGRLMACVAEEHHDEFGLQWPIAIAPYQVNLVSIGKSDTLKSTALSTYELLQRRGLEVLFDDRDASPGVKFADADLRGIPLRVTVSERGMAAGTVELKNRLTGETMHVPHDEIGGLLGGLVGRS